MANKLGKMAGYINYRLEITLLDSRTMQGQLLAFDKHMNLVLADTEEFRKLRPKRVRPPPRDDDDDEIKADRNQDDEDEKAAKDEDRDGEGRASAPKYSPPDEKRKLGLTIIRGSAVSSIGVLSPPPQDPSARLGKNAPSALAGLSAGPGAAKPLQSGRGVIPPGPFPPGVLAGPAAGVGGGVPPPFPNYPAVPGFAGPGRGMPPPPNFSGGFPPPGFPQGYPGGAPSAPPGFNPPPRR